MHTAGAGKLSIETQTTRQIKGNQLSIQVLVTNKGSAHAHGIRTALFMNFGFPGETRADMQATIDLAVRLNPTYASFYLIVPFPGTRLAEMIHLEPEALPAHLYPHYNHAQHDLKTLKSILRQAYLRFYLRPGYWMQFFRQGLRPGLAQARLFLKLLKG